MKYPNEKQIHCGTNGNPSCSMGFSPRIPMINTDCRRENIKNGLNHYDMYIRVCRNLGPSFCGFKDMVLSLNYEKKV